MSVVTFDPIFVITKYSHYFKVTKIGPQGRRLLDLFLTHWIQKAFRQPNAYKQQYVSKEPEDKIFGSPCKDLLEYRFHIGQLAPFQHYLSNSGIDSALYFINEGSGFEPSPLKHKVKSNWTLRDRQPEVVEFITTPMENDNHSRLVTLPTGYGKGLCALWAIEKRGFRTAYIILPSYIEKTAYEIKEKTTATDKDIMVVQGGDSLRGLIELGKTNRYKSDFLLISMKTWTNFITSYLIDRERCVQDEYGCAPEDVYELLGIGTVLIDEIHQHLHAVYRTFCFMNTDMAIGLSATFLSHDQFVDRIQRTMFPKEIRFQNVEMKKYIRAYAISYPISATSMNRIRTSERNSSSYSQNAFERSILKFKPLADSYMELVKEVVANGFMDQWKPGYKCIIFVRTIDMADAIVYALKQRYRHLDIRRYTQEDPYENLLEPDIRVTTQQSGGTAHDIPGLMTNITLDNMSSPVANLQCLGRLREPKEGYARYFAVYSESIRRHVEYHRQRKELMNDRVASFKEFKSNVSL